MGRRHTGRRFVLGVSLLALLGAGCTPDTSTPPPATSTSATPTESAQEREERIAYEAAEKSYREFRAEFNELLASGGAKKATAKMQSTAADSYLKQNLEVVQAYKGLRYHQEGADKIIYVHKGGYSPSSVVLLTCEDASGARTIDKRGEVVGRGDVRTLELEARKTADGWKLWSGTGSKVKTCDS